MDSTNSEIFTLFEYFYTGKTLDKSYVGTFTSEFSLFEQIYKDVCLLNDDELSALVSDDYVIIKSKPNIGHEGVEIYLKLTYGDAFKKYKRLKRTKSINKVLNDD